MTGNIREFYLYKITNIENGKCYIGVTSRPEYRLRQHMGKYSTCTKLKRAVEKYGPDVFKMEVLCIGSQEYILDLEVKVIVSYNSIDDGYNILSGNPRTGDILLPQEVKDKISTSLKAYYRENESSSRGKKLGRKQEHNPCYVMSWGFGLVIPKTQ